MRFIFFLIVFFCFPVAAQAQQLSRHHSITLEVECIETASAAISELDGYNLSANMSLYSYDTKQPQPRGRHANFSRRVDVKMFRHAQEVLRNLGEVVSENEWAWHHGSELTDVETRITVLSQEMERLSLMMAASNTLDVLIAVNDRLAVVSRNRDVLTGRRRALLEEIENPVIEITLIESVEDIRPEPVTFGSRVTASFMGSINNTLIIGGHLLVFFAYISVPAVVFLAIGGVIFAINYFHNKKTGKGQKK